MPYRNDIGWTSDRIVFENDVYFNITNFIDVILVIGCTEESVADCLTSEGNGLESSTTCEYLAVPTIAVIHSTIIHMSPTGESCDI